jgi:hypothetical protein
VISLTFAAGGLDRERSGGWRVIAFDSEGEQIAYGRRENGAVWVKVPAVATFCLSPGGTALTATPAEGADQDAVLDAYLGTALPFALQATCGVEVLHASAVHMPREGCVAAFCGISQAGKSTVAYGLAARGHGHWADDAVAFEIQDDRSLRAVGLPFLVNLRETSAAYFDSAGLPSLPAEGGPAGFFEGTTARLGSVFVLEPVDGGVGAPRLERLAPGVALRALLPNAYRFRPETRARRRQTLEVYLHLVASVSVWQARYPRDINRLPELLDAVEQRIAAG